MSQAAPAETWPEDLAVVSVIARSPLVTSAADAEEEEAAADHASSLDALPAKPPVEKPAAVAAATKSMEVDVSPCLELGQGWKVMVKSSRKEVEGAVASRRDKFYIDPCGKQYNSLKKARAAAEGDAEEEEDAADADAGSGH